MAQIINCSRCWFAHQTQDEEIECRRHAPTAVGGPYEPSEPLWPKVMAEDFCGEFSNDWPNEDK